jgi:hypothetical protein
MNHCVAALLIALPLVLAGALPASAQTVIVQSAPPRSTIELSMNGGAPVSATADANGDATLVLSGNITDGVVLMNVDRCAAAVHVVVVQRGVLAPALAAGCFRVDLGRVFAASAITTFVVDLDESAVSVHLRQGPAPASWLRAGAERAQHTRQWQWSTPAKGLGLFGGAGLSSLSDTAAGACGTSTSTCNSTSVTPVLAAGVDYWITRFVAADVSVVRPSDVTAVGSGDTYKFDSRVTTRLLIVAAKAGTSVGPARIYGLGGLNRVQSTSTTNETLTATGATQTLAQQSQGWSWVAGGGLELAMSRRVSVYGQFTVARVKGTPSGGGEGGIDDRMMFGVIGARLHTGS